MKILLVDAADPRVSLSYRVGWPRNFRRHPRFECTLVNAWHERWTGWLKREFVSRWGRYDAIVLLHSVFSNSCFLREKLFDYICAARQPKAYFIGNEYKLMPEKMGFCDSLGISLLVTMNPNRTAQEMYRERLGCEVVCIPSAGLDTEVFFPQTEPHDRPIDIGYRAFEAALYLGHNERRDIADYFLRNGHGLRLDISLDPGQRFNEKGWAQFLNRCKGQLGTEAGGDYFELTDSTRLKVNEYVRTHPDATMDEIFELFFRDYRSPVPVRTIGGRHAEAAGTKTVQILFEGYYNGYFQPDVHYIPLRKDFSNAGEALGKFKDSVYCREITERAYRVAVEELTYARLIDRFHEALAGVM